MSKRIQLNTIDLGGGTTKGCNCEAPDLSAYAKKDDVPTKVSQLENDSGFVKSTSLDNIDENILIRLDEMQLSIDSLSQRVKALEN